MIILFYLFIGIVLAPISYKLSAKTIEHTEAGPAVIIASPFLCILAWPIMMPLMLVLRYSMNRKPSVFNIADLRVKWYENALKCTELALDALDKGDMASYQLFVRLSELRCNLLETDEFVSSPKIKKLPYNSDHHRRIDAVLSRNFN